MTSLPMTGGCNCGAVRYEVSEPFVAANYCHCTRCQRRTGTASAVNGRAAHGSFRIVSGEDRLRAWNPGIRPSYRQFVDDAAAWEPIPDDGLTRYPERRRAS